ncbi:MAG: hypothetical protein O7G31_09865 [Calditrichaeota bacterium]|nr:hypothetical protein [Calditrichota bacterium]
MRSASVNVDILLIVIGLISAFSAYGFKAFFVDTSDKENPYRMLVAVIGYGGLIAVAWGAVLLLFYGD